jgi:hypothetical protein
MNVCDRTSGAQTMLNHINGPLYRTHSRDGLANRLQLSGWRPIRTRGGREHARLVLDRNIITIGLTGTVCGVGKGAETTLAALARIAGARR